MDIKELKESNEAIEILEQLDLPISIDQLGKRKELETKFLRENVIPQLQSYIQSLVEQLHKSFCLVVEYQYGEPVQVRLAEQTKLKGEIVQRLQKKDMPHSKVAGSKFKSERIECELKKLLSSLPQRNPYFKFVLTQSYSSLSRLLRTLQSNDLLQYTSPLFKSFNLPSNGKITPSNFVNILEPEQFEHEITKDGSNKRIILWSQSQKVEIRDGVLIKIFKADGSPFLIDKTKKIKEGQWSLKTFCELMAQKEYFANKKTTNI